MKKILTNSLLSFNKLSVAAILAVIFQFQSLKAQPGASFNFDGANDYINCGTGINAILDPINVITVEAWVYPTTTAGLGAIVGNYATPGGGMQFLLRRDFSNYYFWVDDGIGFKAVASTSTVVPNTWTHLVGVWNGNQTYLYVNGILDGTNTSVNGPSFPSSGNPVWIGGETAGAGEFFRGNIDEIRIWKTARTPCQIRSYSVCEIPSTATDLIANYHFNQGIASAPNPTVTTLTDFSGSAFTGTLTNTNIIGGGAISNWVTPGGVVSGFTTPVTTAPPSPVGLTADKSLVCLSQALTLTATGATKYIWSMGGVGSSYSFYPTKSDTYTVTGYSSDVDCIGTSTTITVPTANCVGLNYIDAQNGNVSVYPNPSNGQFTIELNNGLEKTIEVIDVTGKTVLNQSSQLDKTTVNINELSNGIYFVKVKSDNSTQMIKVVKQ